MTTTTTTWTTFSAGICWPPFLWILGLHLGALLAFYPGFFSWSAVLVCLALHWVTGGLGICLAYHRLLTHRSFALRPKAIEYLLTMIGCCASEGGAIGWVADHRKHHAHSDEEDDVHSPNRGFGWAHMFWWMTPDITALHTPEYYAKWAPDLNKDPIHRFLDRTHFVYPILLGVGLYAIGGMPWLVWGAFVRSVMVLHTTWLVNSASHVWGYKTYKTRDNSRNLWWVALLTFGEGWHNNHHAFQASARHGLRWYEIDPTYWAVRLMGLVGLAYNIKLPKPSQLRHAALDEPPAAAEQPKERADGGSELIGSDRLTERGLRPEATTTRLASGGSGEQDEHEHARP